MTPAVLAEIEVWATGCKPYRQHEAFTLAGHVPALIAEVRRLRAALERIAHDEDTYEWDSYECAYDGVCDMAAEALAEPETGGSR